MAPLDQQPDRDRISPAIQEQIRAYHIRANVAIRRLGGTSPACGGPECPVCAELADLVCAALADRWQPIETAPKDGTPILIHFRTIGTFQVFWSEEPFGPGIGSWCITDNKYEDRPLRGYVDADAIGWQPLPAAPPVEEKA